MELIFTIIESEYESGDEEYSFVSSNSNEKGGGITGNDFSNGNGFGDGDCHGDFGDGSGTGYGQNYFGELFKWH